MCCSFFLLHYPHLPTAPPQHPPAALALDTLDPITAAPPPAAITPTPYDLAAATSPTTPSASAPSVLLPAPATTPAPVLPQVPPPTAGSDDKSKVYVNDSKLFHRPNLQ